MERNKNNLKSEEMQVKIAFYGAVAEARKTGSEKPLYDFFMSGTYKDKKFDVSKLSLRADNISAVIKKLGTEEEGMKKVTFGRTVFKGIMSAAQDNSIDKNLIEKIFKRLDISITTDKIGEFSEYQSKLKIDGGFGDETDCYLVLHPRQDEVYQLKENKKEEAEANVMQQFLNDYEKNVFEPHTKKVGDDGNCFLYSVAGLQDGDVNRKCVQSFGMRLNASKDITPDDANKLRQKFADLFEKHFPIPEQVSKLRKEKEFVDALVGGLCFNLVFAKPILITSVTEQGFAAILVKDVKKGEIEFLEANDVQKRKDELVNYNIVAHKINHYQPVPPKSRGSYLNNLCDLLGKYKNNLFSLNLKFDYENMKTEAEANERNMREDINLTDVSDKRPSNTDNTKNGDIRINKNKTR